MTTIFNKEKEVFPETLNMETIICCSCGIPFAVPSNYKMNLQRTQDSFYCPNGHSQSYSKSTETILKEKIERLEKEKEIERQKLERTIFYANQSLKDKKTEITVLKRKNTIKRKQLERVKNGVCPCCNRTFQNLMEHMKLKHPESL